MSKQDDINNLETYYGQYLSERLARARVDAVFQESDTLNKVEVVQRCLDEVIRFAYEQVAQKNIWQISDVESACDQAPREKSYLIKSNQEFKEFIYTYFQKRWDPL